MQYCDFLTMKSFLMGILSPSHLNEFAPYNGMSILGFGTAKSQDNPSLGVSINA